MICKKMAGNERGQQWPLMFEGGNGRQQQQWQWRMKIALDGGSDGQRQGGGEMMVTKMAFGSDGSGLQQCDEQRQWRQ
jgi:hypothetical protein